MPGAIRIGTCSWTDRTLLRSGFYPKSATTPASRLAFYATQFDTVEVDSSFYALPNPENAVRWLTGTPREFVFGVKSFALFTFHRTKVASLPKWLQKELGREPSSQIRREELSPEQRLRLYEEFLQTLEILHGAGRLAYLLFQFPPYWYFSRESLAYIRRLRQVSGPIPLALEVRNNTWLAPKNREKFYGTLRDENIAYVAVDEPKLDWTVSAEWPLTAEWGTVVRFHGRNRAGWSNPRASVLEKFDYEYDASELGEWEEAIRETLRSAKNVYLMYNNCVADKAVHSANLMKEIMGLSPPSGPYGRQGRLDFGPPS